MSTAASPAPAPAAAPSADRLPVVRLRPKTGGRFFAGAPWVYGNEVVLDRRTKALKPGVIATLEDAERQPVATIAFNPASKIAGRALARAPDIPIDSAWFEARLAAALSLRERLFDGPYYRLVHAEADGLPGLIIDRFGDALAVQPNAAWLESKRTALLAALDRVLSPSAVVWNGTGRARSLEGLPEEMRLLKGALDGPIAAPMNGALYLADLLGGQKTGIFYDQRPNQAFAASLAKGGRVLDVFCHIGGFGLAALAAGAASAHFIDGSAAALGLAETAAEKMGVADKASFQKADAFDAMRALAADGAAYDLVVCDPPAFAPSRAARDAGLRAYGKTARLGVRLTAPGGVFVLCSCSHAVGEDELAGLAAEAIRTAGRSGRLLRRGGAGPDHPAHPHLAESAYLKALTYLLD